jgi:hypothetical protein
VEFKISIHFLTTEEIEKRGHNLKKSKYAGGP